MRGRRKDRVSYFLSAISPEPNSGCWLWTGSCEEKGYGRLHKPDRKGHLSAHRFAYQTFVGPIPDGHHLDHKCRVRCCVNPEHLEPVTPAENSRRSAEHYRRVRSFRREAAQ